MLKMFFILTFIAGAFLGIGFTANYARLSYTEPIETQAPQLIIRDGETEYIVKEIPVYLNDCYCEPCEEVICEVTECEELDISPFEKEIEYWQNIAEDQKVEIRSLNYTVSQCNL